MKRIFSLSYILWWMIGLIGFHLLPQAISAYYNRATTVDDYCFADTAKTYGIGEAIYLYYTQVNGRYTGIVFHHVLNSMVWDSQWTFQLIPLLAILALGYLMWKIIDRYTQWPMWASILLSSGLWIVFLDTLPSLSEGIFWLSSLHIHGFSWITFLGLLYYLSQAKNSRKSLIGALIIVFLAGGISEATYLNTFVLVWAWGVWWIWQNRKIGQAEILLMGLSLLGLLHIKFSPANLGRQSEDLSHINMAFLLDTGVSLVRFLISQVTWSLGIISLLGLAIGSRWKVQHPVFEIPAWYVFGVVVCFLLGPYVVSSLGIGGVPPRVLNVTYFFFLLSWAYGLIRFSRQLPSWKMPDLAWWFVWVLFAFSTLHHNTRLMYRDWYRGVYSGYAQEVDQRIEDLKSDQPLVMIKPFQNRPYSLFFGEMDRNTNGLWAKCLSQYYQKPIQFIEN